MKINSIIFKTELEFRNYIIYNSDKISKIYIFEDKLDNSIFFYSFTSDNYFIGSKESSSKSFKYYKELYILLSTKLKLNFTLNEKVLKLNKL